MAKQAPIKKFQRGACSVSIFTNEVEKNGKTIEIRKAVFQKRYQDSKGEWATTSSLDANDIPKAALCLNMAYDYLTNGSNKDSEENDIEVD